MTVRLLWFEVGDPYSALRGKLAASGLGVEIDALDPTDLSMEASSWRCGIFSGDDSIVQRYDAVIMRSFMPYVSEALTIARMFHEAGKVVVDACMADEGYAMSKMHDYLLLSAGGIGVPRTRQVFDPDQAVDFVEKIGFPCILKGVHGSQGRHVYKIDTPQQMRKRLLQYHAGELMIQEYLEAELDFRVMVVGYRALDLYVSRKPRPGDFRTNFEFNEEVLPHPLSADDPLRALAERSARMLRREFAGVDIRCRGATPLVLEVNRRPGFKSFEQATGLDVAGSFVQYVVSRCCPAVAGETALA